jgi:hypothetical protein
LPPKAKLFNAFAWPYPGPTGTSLRPNLAETAQSDKPEFGLNSLNSNSNSSRLSFLLAARRVTGMMAFSTHNNGVSMEEPVKKSVSPDSFSFYLLKGESLVYPRGTVTPRSSPYYVQATTVSLTADVMTAWFIDAITPLVGPDAANDLQQLIADDAEGRYSGFIQHAIDYRNSLG